MQDKYVTISRINNYLKAYFDNNPHLQHVYLKGEISNFKNHSRGHLYFTFNRTAEQDPVYSFFEQ